MTANKMVHMRRNHFLDPLYKPCDLFCGKCQLQTPPHDWWKFFNSKSEAFIWWFLKLLKAKNGTHREKRNEKTSQKMLFFLV